MTRPEHPGDGFVWSGHFAPGLDDGRRVLPRFPWLERAIARCEALHFSGTFELLNAAGAIGWQPWIGGVNSLVCDPSVVIFGGRFWAMGPAVGCLGGPPTGFRATQRIPGFDGGLTGDVALEGPLSPGAVERIVALCGVHRLSADLVLRRGDEALVVGFSGGRAECDACANWPSGTYCLRLRPLFDATGGAPR